MDADRSCMHWVVRGVVGEIASTSALVELCSSILDRSYRVSRPRSDCYFSTGKVVDQ
jgi:hypothetical protein